MKKLLYPIFFLAILFLATPSNVKASHAQGADIQVQQIAGLQYQVTLALYRDCSGILPLGSYTVNINSSCATTNVTVNLVGTQSEVSPLCTSQLPNSTCSGGAQSQPGVEQWLYQGTVTLPQACADWNFSFQECNRNTAITTLANAGLDCIYVEALLDNVTAATNSSPAFTTLPVPYICINQPYTYNHGAIDPDGDSLVYSLVDAFTAAGTTVLYSGGFSGTSPMTSVPGVSIDPLNGNILITPTATQVAVLAVLVEEYRNGVLIGSTIRDIQITVLNCANASTVIHPITNLVGGVLTGPSTVEVCPGTPLSFDIPGSDPNDGLGDSVFVSWNNGILAGIFTPDADIDTVTGSFSWTPTVADAGFNSFTVNLRDNGCPVLAAQILAVDVFVFEGTSAGPDQNYCTAGSPIEIAPIGGSAFTWNVISGDAGSVGCNGPACDTATLTPTVTTQYEVVSNFTCNNIDTVVINVVPNFTLGTTPDTAICGGSSFGLVSNPTPSGSYGAYSWNWAPSATLDDDTLTNPVASPTDTTTYDVAVTSAAGCTIRDTVTIEVANVSLSSNPVSDPAQSCQGSPVLLDAQVTVGNCNGYNGASIAHSPVALVSPTSLPLGDEQTSGILPIGFTFDFFCVDYTQFFISSNGWIMFTSQAPDGSPEFIPSPGSTENFIALAWDDLNPGSGGQIRYETQGVSPNRTLVVDYDSVPHFLCNTCFVDGQIIMYEGTNVIEIHSRAIDNNGGGLMTQGIENIDGTDGLEVPGRNSQTWTALLDSYSFTPNIPSTYTTSWQNPLGTTFDTGDSTTVSPLADTKYYSVTEAAGGVCTVVDSITVQTSVADAGTDDCVVAGDSTTLNGLYTGPAAPSDCNVYDIISIPFDTVDISGIATTLLPLANSEVTPRIELGIPFTFFCAAKDSFQVSSNGWLTFTSTTDNDRSEDLIPSLNGNGDYVCIAHDDLDPSIGGASMRIEYAVIGSAPNREFVLNYFDVPHRSQPDSLVSVQVRMFETSNRIEFHNVSIENDGAQITQGLENDLETIGWADPSRNKQIFTAANEGWRFTPQLGLVQYSWSPGDSLSDSTSATPDAFPIVPTTYVLTIDNGVCTMTDTMFVDVPALCTLPIEGLTLEGDEEGSIGRLKWRTAEEEYADFFILERSTDDETYMEIHREDAVGHSKEESVYPFDDLNPVEGLNFYRVIGVDRNGNSVQSNVVALNFSTDEDYLLGVYPNPGQGEFHFDLAITESGRTNIQLFDLTGQQLYSRTKTWDEVGVYTETLDLSGISQGVYIYQVRINDKVFTGKLQIAK